MSNSIFRNAMSLSPFFKSVVGYVVLPVFVTAVVSYIYFQSSFDDGFHTAVRQRLLASVQLIQTHLEALPDTNFTAERLDPIADRLGERCDARVTIIAPDGRVLGDSSIPLPDVPGMQNHAGRPEIREALAGGIGERIRRSGTLDTEMHYVATVFQREGRLAGLARVALPVRDVTWTEGRVREAGIVGLVCGLAAAIGFSLFIRRRMLGPVANLTVMVRRLGTASTDTHPDRRLMTEWSSLVTALQETGSRFRERADNLTEEKVRLEAVLSAMTEGVMVTGADGRIIHVNPALTRMMRVDIPYLHIRPIEMIRNADLQAAVDATLDTAAKGATGQETELSFSFYDQTFQVYMTAVGSHPVYHGLVAVFHDVTELRRLEQVRRDFVANVSHELRTPLTSIKGYAETLLDGALEDETVTRKFVDSIHSHAARLQALVEDLLQLSRIESGRLEIRFRPCALDRLARQVAASFEDRMLRKRLVLTFDFPTLPSVSGDEELIELALFNLLDNAVKYTPEGGSIVLMGYQEERGVVLTVTDTGVGIPSEALSRIFERFFRVDRSRSREEGGTGLGLSIVRHTMEMLHGRVWVESELGVGSTFFIALPVWREETETSG
ncbi:MAG: PAS domain-containing protein [candidate division Zixibacteria bacterium]|nr:PAS domain-containing protein [candidate division Zixibacteria bacterium]